MKTINKVILKSDFFPADGADFRNIFCVGALGCVYVGAENFLTLHICLQSFKNLRKSAGSLFLNFHQSRIHSSLSNQFIMCTRFNNFPIIENENFIRISNGCQSVGNDKAGTTFH